MKALFVVTAANGWTLNDGTIHPTGYWAEELAEPHRLFSEAGWQITVATPGGIAPTVDQISLGIAGGLPATREKMQRYLDSISEQLDNPVPLDSINESDFDLVFYPGGHGPMEDLAVDKVSGALLRERMQANRPLALLCHAPAAILAATSDDGTNPFTGRKMTGLSNVEERMNTFSRKAKWLLQDKMEELGVDYNKALLPFRSHVVTDANLFTGQNPQSANELATAIIKQLQ